MQPLNCLTFRVPEDQWIQNEEQNLGRKIEDSWLTVQLGHQITLLQKCFKTQGKKNCQIGRVEFDLNNITDFFPLIF